MALARIRPIVVRERNRFYGFSLLSPSHHSGDFPAASAIRGYQTKFDASL